MIERVGDKGVRMELHEKLQEWRNQKGLTQEELARCLYVSRTAVSKWESGRGYPSIDSLKAIALFFDVTVDGLLSSGEVLSIAEADKRQRDRRLRELVFSLSDLCMAMLLLLPFFAERTYGVPIASSLLHLSLVQPYMRVVYFIIVIGTSLLGALSLSLCGRDCALWRKISTALSLGLGCASVLVFALSLQPYAAGFAFVLLAIKVLARLRCG